MNSWLLPAIASLFSFGLWGFFTKLSVTYIDAKSALIYQTIGVLIAGLITLAWIGFKPAVSVKGISYATLTGLAYGAGCLFYFIAASKGKIVSVVTLTALYPLVTIALSFLLLKEVVTLKQAAGIVCALVAMTLLAS